MKEKPIGSITIDRLFYPCLSVNDWYDLDITQVIVGWLRRSEENHGLCLKMGPDSNGKACFLGQHYKGRFRKFIYNERFLPKMEGEYKKATNKTVKKHGGHFFLNSIRAMLCFGRH